MFCQKGVCGNEVNVRTFRKGLERLSQLTGNYTSMEWSCRRHMEWDILVNEITGRGDSVFEGTERREVHDRVTDDRVPTASYLLLTDLLTHLLTYLLPVVN